MFALKATILVAFSAIVLFFTGYIPFINKDNSIIPKPKSAEATYQFDPSGGGLITGTVAPVLGLTVPANTGVNTGDWRGAEASDNYHWGFSSTASGYNAYLDIGSVKLHNANKMIIQSGFLLKTTAPSTLVQICDWTSTSGVDNAADAQCTGGGWRTINVNKTAITSTTASLTYDWEIYNGYFKNTATTSLDTPLSNFLNTTNTVRIRYYSTTNTTSLVNIDFLRIYVIVNPVYSASNATVISGGAITGDYAMTIIGGGPATSAQTGSDDARLQVPGTAGLISDFYLSFKDVRTYGGANTILYRAEYSCSATGISIKPKIFNFSTDAWEDLTDTAIACNATDVTNGWAVNNITISDYLHDGEMRIGWYGSAANVLSIRLDTSYMMIGTVTNGTGSPTFGSTLSGSINNTRDLDMTSAATNTWDISAVAKSNTQAFSFIGYDQGGSAVAGSASAGNIDFTLIPPGNSAVTGLFYAARFKSAGAGTVAVGIGDASGLSSATGGYSDVGTTATTAYVYTDNITSAVVTTGGAAGWYTNPWSYIDHETGRVSVRLRTSTSNASMTAANWDFQMVSLQWVEDVEHRSRTFQYDPSGGAVVTGTTAAVLGLTAPATSGVNTGDWRGAEASDNLHWGFTSTTGGYNAYLDFSGVKLNGANKMIIQTGYLLKTTAPATLVQICDWVTTTGVDRPTDTQCTGGGWRTLNLNKTAISSVSTGQVYDYEIYDGYWNSNATTKITTPLSNFIDGTGKVRIRYYSVTNTTSIVNIDFARIFVVVNPVYGASGATQISGGTMVGSYASTTMGGVGQTGIDTARFQVPGTAGALSNFYMSYTGVRSYSGMNTILYRAVYSCSATGITIKPKIYNFNSTTWEDLTSTAITCSTTDATNAWAKYSAANISNYISGGEIRIGWYGSANAVTSIRIDMAYVMVGTTNNGTSAITFGTLNAGTAANAQTLDMTGTLSSWNIASVAKSNTQGFSFLGYDTDGTATAGNAVAANMDFTLIPPQYSQVTGIFFASRHMSGTLGTVTAGIADASGATALNSGGYSAVGAGATTALIYTDNISAATVVSGGAAGWNTNPEDYLDTDTGRMNMRLRTSANSTGANTAQWDFAMLSLQWIDTPPPAASITFSISDSSVGFGSLTTANSRYANTAGTGSDTEVVGHTITASTNSPGGYVMTLNGTTLTKGADTISAIGGVATTSSPGTEQFGVRLSASGGYGVPIPPYGTASYYGYSLSTPNVVAVNSSSDNVSTIYSAYYLANISASTAAGYYTTVLNYTITAAY